MIRTVAKRWRELSGQNSWRGLLEPQLDADMQKYLLHYGSMAQVTYDTFNIQLLSKYAGSSRYSRKNLFHQTGMAKGTPFKYDAVKYIYASASVGMPQCFMVKSMAENPWMDDSNWMGYVAVSTDEGKKALGRRDILVVWRGTVLPVEWMKDFDALLVPANEIIAGGGGRRGAMVHQGFLSLYTSKSGQSAFNKTSAREQVISEVKKQMDKYKNEEISITITGHSLGGALACLNAADIACNSINKSCPVTAFTFGAPQVGDRQFKDILTSTKDIRILSTRNLHDIVPRVPGTVGYVNIGVEYKIDSMKSSYTKASGSIVSGHLLEPAYLHTIATARGGKNMRDIALVNKDSDCLKDEYWCLGFGRVRRTVVLLRRMMVLGPWMIIRLTVVILKNEYST